MRSCPSALTAAVGRVLALELREIPLISGDSGVAVRHRLTVSCRDQTAEIAVQTTAPAQNMSRLLNLNEFSADDQARAVALAAVELLAAMDADIRQRLAPSVANVPPSIPRPVAPEPPTTLVSPAPPIPRDGGGRGRVFACGGFRSFIAGGSALQVLGGGVAWSRRLRVTPLVLALDADLGFGESQNQTRAASAWLGSLGAVLGAARDFGRITAEIGAGLRVGGARFHGEVDGGTVLLPWAGPLLALRLSVQTWRVNLTTRFEAGLAALGAQGTADGQALVSARGLWLAAGVGIGF
ncbi:MAG TPA: hypothetical protein VNO55_12330 [Polyangia bacterium]|nr:hypothetical protein [Polyangia bacterium]